jgi:hypothetical protein
LVSLADISAVHDATAITNWKAAAVLGGAVVEALLLCAIQPLDWKSAASAAGRGDILRWDLSDLIGVAKELIRLLARRRPPKPPYREKLVT